MPKTFKYPRPECAADGCIDSAAREQKYCDKHRQRIRKYGDPNVDLRKSDRRNG